MRASWAASLGSEARFSKILLLNCFFEEPWLALFARAALPMLGGPLGGNKGGDAAAPVDAEALSVSFLLLWRSDTAVVLFLLWLVVLVCFEEEVGGEADVEEEAG